MLNFREELEKACKQAAEKHYLEEVETVFETLLKMLKESSPIEILSAREVVICISKKHQGLFHIHASAVPILQQYPQIGQSHRFVYNNILW